MKEKAAVYFGVLFLATVVFAAVVNSQGQDPASLRSYYEACVDEAIVICQCKAVRSDSRSVNVRRMAAIAAAKESFLTSHRDQLVGEMLAQEIGLKPYKINYYLNKRFFETYRVEQHYRFAEK